MFQAHPKLFPDRVFSATLMILLMCGIVTIFTSNTHAQVQNSGSITGTVQDPNGATLSGVQVTATNPETGLVRETTSGNDGSYSIPVLPTGTYQVTFMQNGFAMTQVNDVIVEAAVPRTIDQVLQVGGVGETIDVTGEAGTLLAPDTATTARRINAEEIVQVPTSTRSFTHLLSTEAGVSSDLPPVAVNGNGNISPSVNGTRTTSTSLFFNGIDATNLTSNEGSLTDNIAPAPETLEEVKLQTSLYDASTGRSGGGNFQLITKSGTNQFNGSAYYFVQNEKFNANDFFFNRDGLERPRARRNEGGFTIGGPIIQERFFFFGGYQRTQANTGLVPTASSQTTLPAALGLIPGARTAENLAAAFRQLNSSFPLTAAQISPLAIQLLNTRNPLTGDYIIPSPRAGARSVGVDQSVALSIPGITGNTGGGNPLVRQRNVFPAAFEQDQFSIKLDGQLTQNNRLSGTFFFSNFPGLDPFTEPNAQASPFQLKRDDRNRTLAVSDTHIFGANLINEVRFGYFSLNNTRTLDDPFLTPELSSQAFGIVNPALFFDDSPGTRRLGHFVGRNNISGFAFGGTNDSFNQREQKTYSFSDNVTYVVGKHTLRFGGEYKRQQYDTALPEEQATEFEKFDNFTQILLGRATEADTQFGTTVKEFRFGDASGYIADDFKLKPGLTLNLGLRYEFYGLPTERNGRIGNFDPALLTSTENPLNAFIVPSNVRMTGLQAVDDAIAVTTRANTKHTLNGQDTNNFAPRFGFAYSPSRFNNRVVIRGGYGIFYDRPSTAFINTIFSNYPFLRESEVTAGAPNIPIQTAFSTQNPQLGLNNYLPARIVYEGAGTFRIRDNTGVTTTPIIGSNGQNTSNPIDLGTGQAIRGNVAETFEFRAIDRDLKTPYIQQYNVGVQYELGRNNLIEVRYVGTKGTKLLQAVAINQGFDLNDPATPDFVFARFTQAYETAFNGAQARVAAGTLTPAAFAAAFPNGALRSGSTARARGTGVAFGFNNVLTGNPVDLNLTTNSSRNAAGVISGGTLIGFEARTPVLGFNVPEAIFLRSDGNSNYNSLQVNFARRLSQGLQFNSSYTFSKSIDTSSSDPGSTAGGGRPDVPNAGFIVQGDSNNPGNNRALSDFDRTHRISATFVYNLPTFGSTSRFLSGFQLAGFLQAQSGTPFSIFSPEGEAGNVAALATLRNGSGGIYRLGFGRPNVVGDLRNGAGDGLETSYFNQSALSSPLGGFGNLGRNTLRGLNQKRFDLSLSKRTRITENTEVELRADAFNLFNNVNFANPSGDISDGTDFGLISNTIGGPRVFQFGAKLRF
ncbi:MAG: carboxypeptidase-like regulatory domain-containing protein [Pyrinomonadaceae bacterium MAG19_C2-C3]|nr:carboxypeptidase-like regulatory domain-containing protein [Pyrinomonadaceae bacterium MAG19_C2-C3]